MIIDGSGDQWTWDCCPFRHGVGWRKFGRKCIQIQTCPDNGSPSRHLVRKKKRKHEDANQEAGLLSLNLDSHSEANYFPWHTAIIYIYILTKHTAAAKRGPASDSTIVEYMYI